jgi:hypothetical protein
VTTLWATGAVPSIPLPSFGGHGSLGVAGAVVLAVGAGFALHRRRVSVRRPVTGVVQGLAVLRTPGRYLRPVVVLQLAAWSCRIGVVLLVLGAFHIPAGVTTAALIVTLNGVSTTVPVPGGAGTQQVLAAFALRGIASAAGAVSFSLGLQAGITIVNTTVGIAGAMLLFGTLRPDVAVSRARIVVGRRRG